MIVRHAVRALMIDPADRVLLISMFVPDSGKTIWLAPGGGIEGAEDPVEAVRREVWEETGLVASRQGEVRGPVWRRSHRFKLRGEDYEQHERYFTMTVPDFEPTGAHNPALLEAELVRDQRWWTRAEIAASEAIFVPMKMAVFLEPLMADDYPEVPVEVGV